MNETDRIIDRLLNDAEPLPGDLAKLLALEPGAEAENLFNAARKVKLERVGGTVHLRGLIEYSNVCTKNCFYCGIRRGNAKVERYTLSEDEVLEEAMLADKLGLGSIVIQSGERSDPAFVDTIERLLGKIKRESSGRLGITLSVGEQTPETFRRWFAAGAHRYLLRIESSDPALYAKLHPADHSWEKRRACIAELAKAGYQAGTGVMLGLPFQTLEHIEKDILFFRDMNIDMIGMGPYIVHDDTPLAKEAGDFDPERQLFLGLKAVAVTRIVLKDVNIASTTALQALRADGRMLGLKVGANVVMPNITESTHRADYQLYRGKPGVHDDAFAGLDSLRREVAAIGETIAWNDWGDSPHFFARNR